MNFHELQDSVLDSGHGLQGFCVALILLGLMACGGQQKVLSKEETQVAEVAPVDSALEARVAAMLGIGYPKLTNENTESFLTEWGEENGIRNVILETKHGEIELELFEETPMHSLNFLYKIHRQYYTETEFTRVVPDFVIQGGNSEEEKPQQQRFLIGQHTFKPELKTNLCIPVAHWQCREVIRTILTSVVRLTIFTSLLGRKIGDVELVPNRTEKNKEATPQTKRSYKELGGAPHLDGEHTVFGKL